MGSVWRRIVAWWRRITGAPARRDMAVRVKVEIDGHLGEEGALAARATYSQLHTEPRSPGVVDAAGDIDLRRMRFDRKRYRPRTVITFVLSGKLTDQTGVPTHVRFPRDPAAAASIKGPQGVLPGQIMVRSGSTREELVFVDINEDGQVYDYTLKPVAETDQGHREVRFDPRIINR